MTEPRRLSPPDGFARIRLPLVQVRPTDLLRIHGREVEACHFGRSGHSRFDDPERQFGVFYGGIGLACCIAETILGALCAGRIEPPVLDPRKFADQRVCRIEFPPGTTLSLVDLTGAGLLQLGADARLEAEADYRLSQAWSRALWAHPAKPDGILYRSSYDTSRRCIALYDRVRRLGLIVRPEGALFDHPDLAGALRRYAIGTRGPQAATGRTG